LTAQPSTSSGLELCPLNVGVAFRLPLTNKRYAETIREMVETGEQASISIGFTSLKTRNEVLFGHPVKIVEEAEIREVSLVPRGACKQAVARIIDANCEPPLNESVSSDMFGIEYGLHNIRSIKEDNETAINWLKRSLSTLEAGLQGDECEPANWSTDVYQSNRLQTEKYDRLQSARRAMLGM
jgi:hypothetical protein